jgi:hypothetical protein
MSNFPPVFSSPLTQEPIRKQLQFSLLNAQDTVKISEFQVTHRDLYTPTDRLPVKDGVLDRRLVSCPHLPMHNATDLHRREQQRRTHSARPAASILWIALATTHISNWWFQYSTSATSSIPLPSFRPFAK